MSAIQLTALEMESMIGAIIEDTIAYTISNTEIDSSTAPVTLRPDRDYVFGQVNKRAWERVLWGRPLS